jgi:hypothetical protein
MAINQAGLNVNVKVNLANNRLSTPPTQPITLKATARTINNIKDLSDVVEGSPVDGMTLVYNAATDKYEVRNLNAQDIALQNINGGTF